MGKRGQSLIHGENQRRCGPDFSVEASLHRDGLQLVAGVDEAGRGPLAGPVVAAAVILNEACIPAGLDDSKAMTARRRAQAFDAIMASAKSVAIVSMSAATIDASDIRKASLAAMARAIHALALAPDAALFDGRDIPADLPTLAAARAVIGGDAKCLSIAAASILAKVTRDRMLVHLDACHPAFGFAGHKGYGATSHREAIAAHGGIDRVHRFSFRPLRAD